MKEKQKRKILEEINREVWKIVRKSNKEVVDKCRSKGMAFRRKKYFEKLYFEDFEIERDTKIRDALRESLKEKIK